jgi:transmembrane sensor
MHEQYDEIGEILAKYPDINLEQDAILKDWINQSDTNRKIFEELSSPDYLVNEIQLLEQLREGTRESWQKVQDDINRREVIPVAGKLTWLHKWQTYVAAASVIIIAGVLIYNWQGNKPNNTITPAPTVVKVNDVEPGTYKAKLTLNDGTEIVLDSATNKILAQQAGIRIVNKDGQLVYEQTGNSKEVLYNTVSTSRGQTYATVLSDGTKVWLNSQSSIRFPMAFNGDVRTVETNGEVYFEVAPSVVVLANGQKGKRPFIVNAPGQEVEVLGTHFNVNSYADEPAMKTTLLEGKVKVRSIATNAETVLVPGEQAKFDKQTQALTKTKDVDIDAEVAWRFGMFQFNNADLKTVMRQLERWYDVQVVYEGNVGDFEFLGKIPRNMNLSQVLTVLQKVNVHFKIDGKKIIVTP